MKQGMANLEQQNRILILRCKMDAKCFLTIVLLIAFAGKCIAANVEDSALKIGLILPLSGEFAVLGDACRRGAALAASELKDENINFELLVEDSPSAGAHTTLTAYQKLKSIDQVKIFFGFVSSEELAAVGPHADREGDALVGFAASKNRPKNSLLIWMSPDIEAQRLAAAVYQRFKQVALLSADQEWETQVSDAFSKEFERLGGKIVLRTEAPYASKDVMTEALKVKKTSAQALVIPPYSLFSSYAKALRRLEIALPVYSIELDQNAIDDSQGAAEGAIVIRPAAANEAFNQKYAAHNAGCSADIPASQCYDGMKIIGEGFQNGARSGVDFVKYFENLKEYKGASGSIHFQGSDTIFDTELAVVSHGKLIKE
jgi:ABC-type branched-subunit amino acid transport system substrate-binding protein